MDRRAAGALLALAACIACSAAAPMASNHTALDLYEGASEGCYYNFQHYGEGDRIMTNEPCLNCTCHNRMLMCYLRVCPFTKPIGQDCTVEKRADQCCPIVTCPDVPVDLLTSTSTTSPAEYGATGLGKLDKYGCSIHGKYFPEGSKVPPTPNKPCEHCYCIRNMTTCVMQECTLHVDGCTPIYHKDVCCPIRYSCDHPEDEVLQLDDMSTTVRPTPGFLLTTTTLAPATQMSQDCVHNDQIIADGASITTEKACEHCYCMKGDIVCVVQECGAPMENEGKNCTSLPPRDGQCCPDTYICEGDELSSEIPNESTTETVSEKQTTLSPPKRSGSEGSGYRNEPNEAAYTGIPSESDLEGSGEELEPTKPIEEHGAFTFTKPFETEEVTTSLEDGDQYIRVTTKKPAYEETETSTKEDDKTIDDTSKDFSDVTSEVTQNVNLPYEPVSLPVPSAPENYDQRTTESIESLNTVPDISPDEEHKLHEHATITTDKPIQEESKESEQSKDTSDDKDVTVSPISELTLTPENYTPSTEIHIAEQVTQKESTGLTSDLSITADGSTISGELETVTDSKIMTEQETEEGIPSATNAPVDKIEKSTTELNLAQNTVISSEEESQYPHIITSDTTEKNTASDLEGTEKAPEDNTVESEEQATTVAPVLRESESTAEPDKGLNTIPSEIDEQPHSPLDVTSSSVEIQTTGAPHIDITDRIPVYDTTKSPIATDTTTLTPDAHVTKADQYTTEPSFRKEDKANISTETAKQELKPTTIKTDLVEEELIPTSPHEEKLSTGPDVPLPDEDITTMVPEYVNESEATVAHKESTIEPNQETSVSSETPPEKVAETTFESSGNLLPSTEKSTEVTALLPEVDTHEEPSRIPGEGDCLLNGVTYRNNTIVPSTNNCHTGCKCISSIIKCDPIICSPPPDYMSNCQSIYDTPDSCCPTYVCDHPRETIPPQSDNQMSGTESPIISPTIECRGDQCELNVPDKPTDASELCASGNCLSTPIDKTGTDECGVDGCSELVKEPVSLQPSEEHPGCADAKCESHKDNCENGKCQLLPTDSQESPNKHCNGDDCVVHGEETLSPQVCKNGQNCNEIETPITETATDVNCENGDCDSGVTASPHKNKQEICHEKDGCKSVEITPTECEGDKPCRRHETSISEQLPPKCEGNDCVQKTDSPLEYDITNPSTVSSTSDKTSLNIVTDKMAPADVGDVSESTDSLLLEQKISTTVPTTQTLTEETEKIFDKEKEIVTEEPNLMDEEGTKNPNAIESFTDTTLSVKDVTTQIPHIIENTEKNESTLTPELVKIDHTDKDSSFEKEEDNQVTLTPELVKVDHTDKEVSIEKQVTQQPDESDQEQTTKQNVIENIATNISDLPEEYTPKSTDVSEPVKEHFDETTVFDESVTKTSEVTEDYEKHTILESASKIPDIIEQHTDQPITITEDVTKLSIDVTKDTDIPHSIEENQTKMPDVAEKQPEDLVISIEEESTNIPDVTKKYSDKITETPEIVKEHTDEMTSAEEISTKTPDVIEKHTPEPIPEKVTETPDHAIEYTDKPSSVEDQKVEIPDADDKMSSDKEKKNETPEPTDVLNEKVTETSDILKDHSDKSPTAEEFSTKKPDVKEEQNYVPVFITEEGTVRPDYEADRTEKPTSVEEELPAISDNTSKEPEEIFTPGEEESTTKTQEVLIEEATKVPDTIKEQTDQVTNAPEVGEKQIDESIKTTETATKIPDTGEHTYIPVVITEKTTNTPHDEEDDLYQTSSPDEHEIQMPDDHVDKTDLPHDKKDKPILVEEELPEKSTDVKDETVEMKPEFSDAEGVTEPVITEESGTDSQEVIEDSSRKPVSLDKTTPIDNAVNTNELPYVIDKTSTETPNVVDDGDKAKPSIIENIPEEEGVVVKEDYTPTSIVTEYTDKPEIFEVHTKIPELKITEPQESQILNQEDLNTKAPETYITQSEKDMKLPESMMEEHTTSIALDKVTQVPSYESQTTDREGSIEPVAVTNEVSLPDETSKSPDKHGSDIPMKEAQDSSTGSPIEVTTETANKQDQTTNQPLHEEDQTTYNPSKHITIPHELMNASEASQVPETIMTTESVEKITKSTEHEVTHEKEEGYIEPEPLATKPPAEVVIESHEEEQPQSLDTTQASQTGEESTTKIFEEEKIKFSAPESHVTDIPSGYGDTSTLAETERVTEVSDTETQKTKLPEPHEDELENMSTKVPLEANKDDLNMNQSDIYTPEKEEMITSTIRVTDATPPVKYYTETTDVYTSGEEDTANKPSKETTEHSEQPTTKPIEDNSEIFDSSSKTTIIPEEYNTESQEVYTKPSILEETKPSETNVVHTTPKSSDLSQETDSGTLISGEPNRRTETADLEKSTAFTPEIAHNTELPLYSVTKSEPTPAGTIDITDSEEKITGTPDLYPPMPSDTFTVEPHLYTTSEPAATGFTEMHEPASTAPEQIKTTESSYSEPHTTFDQETDIKLDKQQPVDKQETTIIPELSAKPSSDTPDLTTESEMLKSSSETPATFMEIRTDLPHGQIITEAPLSLVTEPDVSMTTKKHGDTEEVLSNAGTDTIIPTTEREDAVTLSHKTTIIKEMETTKPAETSVEFSETTPYLIELVEHTHKTIEEETTPSSTNDKESTYETEEVIATSPPSKEEHVDAHEAATPPISADEHTVKIHEPISSIPTSVEDYTQKIAEVTTNLTPIVSDVTTEIEPHGVDKITDKIPEQSFETVTKPSESSISPSEETSTISDIVSHQTTLSETKETSTEAKPALEQKTEAPTIDKDSDLDQKDLTTSKAQDLEETTPAAVKDTTQKSPLSESDIKVPTKDESSHTPTTTTRDELIYSTTKATTVKQEELVTPLAEDKYSPPEEKPTSEAVSSTSTAEIPKPPSELEPTDEIASPEDDGLSPGVTGYGEPDYPEEDQAFGPGTCRYGGKVYVSAQQIPRDDPCDFCFCFRSDIICLQQSCPPPIHGCHEEPIQGFCCPRYECPVSMATTVNVTTTTTTTTTTLPPHFPTHGYKGAAQRRGCQIKGHTYKVGEVVRSSSGPCLHCTCGGDGQMKCDPKACTPEPMLRQMIAAAVSAKRRR